MEEKNTFRKGGVAEGRGCGSGGGKGGSKITKKIFFFLKISKNIIPKKYKFWKRKILLEKEENVIIEDEWC